MDTNTWLLSKQVPFNLILEMYYDRIFLISFFHSFKKSLILLPSVRSSPFISRFVSGSSNRAFIYAVRILVIGFCFSPIFFQACQGRLAGLRYPSVSSTHTHTHTHTPCRASPAFGQRRIHATCGVDKTSKQRPGPSWTSTVLDGPGTSTVLERFLF